MMYFRSALCFWCLLHVLVSNVTGRASNDLQACEGGYCLPKHLCPSGRYGAGSETEDGPVTLLLDKTDECGSPLKICCLHGHHTSNDHDAPSQYACGVHNPGGLVYKVESNLTYANYGEFPWTVAIFRRPAISMETEQLEYIGGGSLIHPMFVLTNTKVLEESGTLVARFGEWDITSEGEKYGTQDIDVEEKLFYMRIRDNVCAGNDIGLAKLKHAVTYKRHIRPICLPERSDVFDGQLCTANGWGLDVRTNKPSDVLKRIDLPIVPRNQCQKWLRTTPMGSSFELHRSYICAGGEAGVDTCDKDGGSPLACPRPDGTYVVAGIVSWGVGDCGQADIPGVYTDVSKFVRWINSTIEEYEEMSRD